MRWILVFLFLYLIPLIVLFRNYNNFRRSCIYSSIYVVLVTMIAITNMYVSGLNKIKEAMYYQNYASERGYTDKYASNFEKDFNQNQEQIYNQENNNEKDMSDERNTSQDKTESMEDEVAKEIIEKNEEEVDNVVINDFEINQDKDMSDKELVSDFKKEVYEIETAALFAMRECIPYTKNISENINQLSNIKQDVEYATQMCEDVVSVYSNMEIPELSKSEYTKVVDNSRNDVKTAYELRLKAMENVLILIDSKNPKYVGKITEYFRLSDQYIASFKERLSDLDDKIDNQETAYN